ncbi:CLK4-associating serine/arginine rich protein-like [Ruditapes philippinarum]|uniref:CLK4-associating serine/arginine rich protein-like n=1 Tax=Ruditapes philippinarum TaxID=129788 RepID=UPI00295B1572|nr:CLK4-associating serine/arginine rich protein-like [Ruditapes philippinarum]XP_060554755.1 CLK4-associating serine/arginine rich protein-like [Ruditapes philippinarum]
MWHEARRQEKKIRGLMVDYKRRAERRREFYEKIRADPALFVRVFGQQCKVNLDPAIALAAESPQSMMPWQGDKSNMIDRFDVRAHLDILPAENSYKVELSKEEEDEERRANYERYRILVENECAGLTEEQALHQLYLDEQFGAINKDGEEEKNKLRDKKAAIGYTYDDSTEDKQNEDDSEDSESEEEEDIETLDLDIVVDVDTLNEDQIQQFNVCGTAYGMGKQDYIKYLRRDKDDQEALKQAKLLEEEKAQFAGRKSRRERRIYKEKRLAGRKLSPPSYAARDSPKYEPYRRSTSRSKSRSPSPPRRRRKMYITSFGDNESDDDGDGVVQGPALPPGFGGAPETESTNQKPSASWESKSKKESIRKRLGKSLSPDSSPRSRDIEYSKRRSRSRSNDRKYRSRRSRSRSRGRRSRSRSRDRYSRSRRSRDRSQRSVSHERWQRSRDRRSSGRSRGRRSSERSRGYRSRSRSRRSRSNERKPSYRQYSRGRSRSKSRSRRPSSSSSRSSSKSSRNSRSKSRSPTKPVVKRYRRESLSSNSSSDSDKSPPRKSSTNTPSSRQKSGVPGATSAKSLVPYGKPSSISQVKLTPQERLKKKMQIALSKQYKADKKAEVMRIEKIEQEKMDREEELRQRAVEMRRREREKRHREMVEYGSDSDISSGGSSPPRRRERSPAIRSRRDNGDLPSRSKQRSRSISRSRSRSPDSHKRIVDY